MVSRRRTRAFLGIAARRATAWLVPATLALALLPPMPSQAQMLCSKPLQPLCSTDVQEFTDETQKQRCLGDTEKYLEDLGTYRACLEEAIAAAEESVEEAERFKRCLDDDAEDCGMETDSNM